MLLYVLLCLQLCQPKARAMSIAEHFTRLFNHSSRSDTSSDFKEEQNKHGDLGYSILDDTFLQVSQLHHADTVAGQKEETLILA